MRRKILKAAANLDPALDLNLSGDSEIKIQIKIKIMKPKGGANGKAGNGDSHPVACHYHERGAKGEGRGGLRSRLRPRRLRFSGRGFTLIEMIGVLAVIAILAALLIPK